MPRPEPGVRDATLKHRIPVIDRMMDVLAHLEAHPDGATIRDVVAALKLPRTTIYRILNTLERHDMVRRDGDGAYQLGGRLVSLAAHSPATGRRIDLVAVAQPILDRLSTDMGEGTKLNVLDGDTTLVVAVAQGRREYALAVVAGQRLPCHAGAAGKLLLAYLPESALDERLARPLAASTPRTVTDPARLRAELARIRRQGWSQDNGESIASVFAYAAPVFDPRGGVLAALSMPFLAGTDAERMEQIRLATIGATKAITDAVAVLSS